MEKQNDTPETNFENAASVGASLKRARLAQKKTLDIVSKALCIRKIYIKAIEENNYDELHPVPYGIGFVRSYAEYLGLNSEPIVQRYKEEAMPQKKEESSKNTSVSSHKIVTMPNRRQILIGIFIIFGIYLIWLLSYCQTETEMEQTNLQTIKTVETPADAEKDFPLPELPILTIPDKNSTITEDVATDTETSAPTTENTNENSAQISQIKITEESYDDTSIKANLPETNSRVVVKFKGESWLEIRDDKKIYITGIFEKDYVYNVPDLPGLKLSVGRYYNVDIYIDGKLTTVARPRKQTNIDLDSFLNH